jgi:hypothetical protein
MKLNGTERKERRAEHIATGIDGGLAWFFAKFDGLDLAENLVF